MFKLMIQAIQAVSAMKSMAVQSAALKREQAVRIALQAYAVSQGDDRWTEAFRVLREQSVRIGDDFSSWSEYRAVCRSRDGHFCLVAVSGGQVVQFRLLEDYFADVIIRSHRLDMASLTFDRDIPVFARG